MMADFDPRLNNPYVGPRPFEKKDKLFGREREKHDLYNLLVGRRTVLLFSPSGAGKTSLINAGLSRLLDDKKMPTLPVVRVNHLPPPSFIASQPTYNRYLVSAIMSLEGIQENVDASADLVSLAGLGFAKYLEQRKLAFPLSKGSLGWVVVFDQFEEILTQDLTDEAAKREFFVQLGDVLRDPSLYTLFAMREDYTASLEPFFRLLPGGMEYRYRLDFLRKDQARQAIVGPSASAEPPVKFHEQAAEELLNDLRKVSVQLPDGSRQEGLGPYIEPVQLSVVCRRLWECRSRPDQITLADLGKLPTAAPGGASGESSIVDQALQDFYVGEILKVAGQDAETGRPEDEVLERRIRWWFSDSLILGDLRGQVLKQVSRSAGLENELIERLVRTHLVRSEQRRGLTWYELAHDRLVPPIKRSNSAYFGSQDYQLDYRRQALVWDAHGRSADLLLTREQLEKAQIEQALQGDAVSPLEREFVLESQKALRLAEAEDLQRQKRRAERGLNLEDTGWGIIFPAELPPDQCEALKMALHELLQHRGRQAMGKRREYFKEFSKSLGYQRGESAHDFIVRHGAASGVNTPDKLPYYLLIVGGPEMIPFEFQFELDERFAAGRLAFDTLEEYASYARSVVLAESETWTLEKKARLFSHSLDPSRAETYRKYLIEPLLQRLGTAAGGWQVLDQAGAQAGKTGLARALGGEDTPALLFSNTDGISPYHSKEAQSIYQNTGGLVIDGMPPQGAFTGEDVSEQARLGGLVAFLLGAYSAGTQAVDDFWWYDDQKPRRQSGLPFVAALPKRLLGHPQGGALAVIGHVDNLWSSFYMSESRSPDIEAIAAALERLMDGHTVGSALEPLNLRYRRYAGLLSEQLVEASFRGGGRKPDDLRELMVRTIDARNLILLGDPAARLPLEGGPLVQEPPVIEPVAVAGASPAQEAVPGGSPPAPAIDRSPEAAAPPPPAPGAPAAGEQAEPAPAELLAVSGIWAETGAYLLELAPQALAAAARGEVFDHEFTRGLQYWYESRTQSTY